LRFGRNCTPKEGSNLIIILFIWQK
jgi:hypothetical protein